MNSNTNEPNILKHTIVDNIILYSKTQNEPRYYD